MHVQFSSGNLKRRNLLGNLGIGGTMILNCTLKRTGHEYLMCSESSTECSGGGASYFTLFVKYWGDKIKNVKMVRT